MQYYGPKMTRAYKFQQLVFFPINYQKSHVMCTSLSDFTGAWGWGPPTPTPQLFFILGILTIHVYVNLGKLKFLKGPPPRPRP